MAATGLTRQLITNTTRLRALVRSVDPYTVIAVVALLVVVVAIELRSTAQPAAVQPQTLIVIATPTLGVAREKVGAIGAARLRTSVDQPPRPTAIVEPTVALVVEPQPEPIVAPVEQEQTIEVVNVEPTVAPTIQAEWHGETFVMTGDSVPTVAPAMLGQPGYNGWVCGQTYGDWRDSDPMYTHAECYGK